MFGRPIDKIDKTKAKRSSTTDNRRQVSAQSASRGGKPSPQMAAKAKMVAKPASAMRPKAKADNGSKPILKP